MLDKLHTLQNVGLFETGVPKAVHFLKANLIYAENGRGKSTLASILRACSEGDATAVSVRKTLDVSATPKVGMLFGTAPVNYENGAWTGNKPSILVFDGEFVERNVYSGNEVRADQRQSLLEFALGDKAVDLKRTVDRVAAQVVEATKERTAAENVLTGYRGPLPIKTFRDLVPDSDADKKIASLRDQIANARQQQGLQKRLDPLPLPLLQHDLDQVFAVMERSITGIEKAAEDQVKTHIADHGGVGVEEWISKGQSFVSDDSCPFCGQDVAGNNLLRAYQSYFNKEYSALKEQLAELDTSIKNQFPKNYLQNLIQPNQTNLERISAWSDHLQLQIPTTDFNALASEVTQVRNVLRQLVTQKRNAPLEAISTGVAKRMIGTKLESINHVISTYNVAVETNTKVIAAFKAKLARADISELEAQVLQLENQKKRHSPEVVEAFKNYDLAESKKVALEKEKKEAREQLDTLMDQTLKTFGEEINKWLTKFGAAFTIEQMKPSYQGGGLSRTDFGLRIRNKVVKLGSRGSTEPSFATTLSEGDKRTLAFAFFLARLFQYQDISRLIVVIDDPVTSLDKTRRSRTKDAIEKIASDCEQVIILAHDAHFLRSLEQSIQVKKKIATKVLEVKRVANEYSILEDGNLDQICSSDYTHHYFLVQDFVDGPKNDNLREVAKALRPLVEGHLHKRFPGHVQGGSTLGEVIDRIRNAKDSSPLIALSLCASELSALNDYASRYHHDTNLAADSEPVTDGELLGYCKQALALIHKGGF